MSVQLDVSEVARSLVPRPATPVAPPAVVRPRRVIDVDLREEVPSARARAHAREAAVRYGEHGTTLLGGEQVCGAAAQAGRQDAVDGWTLVGRWLTFVAVLSVCVIAFAMIGGHAAR